MRQWVGSWTHRNLDYECRVFDDHDCLVFVAQYFPELVDVYQTLRPVEKADLWRYLVILERGGVYADVDTICHTPLRDWLKDDDAVVIFSFRPTSRCRSNHA